MAPAPRGCGEGHAIYRCEHFGCIHKEEKTSTGHGENWAGQRVRKVSRHGDTQ